MQIVNEIGNRALKEREKALFLSSKRAPISLYDTIFGWVESLTQKDDVTVSVHCHINLRQIYYFCTQELISFVIIAWIIICLTP